VVLLLLVRKRAVGLMAASICVALSWQHTTSASAHDAPAAAPATAPASAAQSPGLVRPINLLSAPAPSVRSLVSPAPQTVPATTPARPAPRVPSVSRSMPRKPTVRHKSQPVRPSTQAHSPRQRRGFGVWGVDVSRYQHPRNAMNWSALSHAAPGFGFTFVKASAGGVRPGQANLWHDRDEAAAKAAGAYVGSYHYASPGRPVVSDALWEARKAVHAAGARRAGDLPLALDFEANPNHLNRRQMARWALTWLRQVERLTGHPPVLYTYANFFSANVGPNPAFRRYPLWIAHYGNSLTAPRIPRPWSTWTFWQHSSQGRLPGAATDVDLNVFRGSKKQLASLAGIS
jgi:GH25 family lysozyme M1 (1,4-beta-N-acetylmuramidase)